MPGGSVVGEVRIWVNTDEATSLGWRCTKEQTRKSVCEGRRGRVGKYRLCGIMLLEGFVLFMRICLMPAGGIIVGRVHTFHEINKV